MKELELVIQSEIEQEDIPFEGNVLASGDDQADREQEEWTREQLRSGNDAAWCQVMVVAKFYFTQGYPSSEDEVAEGRDHLGAVSYPSEQELWLDLGPEMRRNAVTMALEQLLTVIHTNAAHVRGPCGSCEPPGILQDMNSPGETQTCDECAIYPSDRSAQMALRANPSPWVRSLHKALQRWLARHAEWAVFADQWLEAHQ